MYVVSAPACRKVVPGGGVGGGGWFKSQPGTLGDFWLSTTMDKHISHPYGRELVYDDNEPLADDPRLVVPLERYHDGH